jgi:copper chaperone NosL
MVQVSATKATGGGSTSTPLLSKIGDKRMRPSSRIVIIVAALLLSLTYYFPLWKIDLIAPQYPEGLGLRIWINSIGGMNEGDLNRVNMLNHYIGMKAIKPDSIKELKIMPWIMRGLLLLGVVVGVIGKRRFLLAWIILFLLMSTAGLVDYYLWGYDYGHNLDLEHASIKVEGMTYQPPLIGTKNLLNFKAVSLPDGGGYAAIVSLLLAIAVYIREFYYTKTGQKR